MKASARNRWEASPRSDHAGCGLQPFVWAAIRDEKGSIYAEYVIVLTVFAMLCVAATVAVGLPLLRHFQAQVAWLLLPIP